jgi:hypothetical protein
MVRRWPPAIFRAGGLHLIGCPRLFSHYIRGCSPFVLAISFRQMTLCYATVTGHILRDFYVRCNYVKVIILIKPNTFNSFILKSHSLFHISCSEV